MNADESVRPDRLRELSAAGQGRLLAVLRPRHSYLRAGCLQIVAQIQRRLQVEVLLHGAVGRPDHAGIVSPMPGVDDNQLAADAAGMGTACGASRGRGGGTR
ncbi:hypothetical protein D3C71_1854610 [compost metagenome]